MTNAASNESIEVVAVDDDELSLELIRRYLRKTPHNVTTFLNAEIALEHLKIHSPSFLIVDQRMPKMDGLELLEFLRSAGRLTGVKTFLCSSTEIPEAVQNMAENLGVVSLIKDTLSHRDNFLAVTRLG